MACQVAGAIAGAALADAMFAEPVLSRVPASPRRRAGPAGRGRGDGGPAARHRRPGPDRPHPACGLGGRRLDRRGVLVHLLHLVRQPRRHHRPGPDQHLCRDRPVSVPAFIAAQVARRPHRHGCWPSCCTRPGQVRQPRARPAPARWLTRKEAAGMAEIPEVLFVCTHNAGRSQMAAALLDQAGGRAGPGHLGRITARQRAQPRRRRGHGRDRPGHLPRVPQAADHRRRSRPPTS